jgi:arsenate reductase
LWKGKIVQLSVYGIKNCDTMKKTFAWLDGNNIPYVFHDYKKAGVDMDVLSQAIAQHGWENVINRKGTSWRALPEEIRNSMDAAGALKAAIGNPSLIRRPLIVSDGDIYLGFNADDYSGFFQGV